MKSILWLEIRTFRRLIRFIILFSALVYPLLFVFKYFNLSLYFGYLPILLIVLLPTTIQSDKFRRIDKVKGLIDYYLVMLSARELLLARSLVGGLMGLTIFLISLPAVILADGWIYLKYLILAIFFTSIYITVEGYSTWYGRRDISVILALMIVICIIVMMGSRTNIFFISIIAFTGYGSVGTWAIFNAEKDRERIIQCR